MPEFLMVILMRNAQNSISRGDDAAVTRNRIRQRYDLSMQSQIADGTAAPMTATQARQIYERAVRRRDLAHRIQGGEVPPRPQNMPRCPERNHGGAAQCHATVYVDFVDDDGNECGRVPTYIDFPCGLSGAEIIALAVAEVYTAIVGDAPSNAVSDQRPELRVCTPVEDGATIGEVCYG